MPDNAKVNFKRGLQTSIDTMLANPTNRFDEGTFYLTTDSNRLYFAQTNSKLVDLNQYIHFYSNNNNEMPTAANNGGTRITTGDFYYWQEKNALLICRDAALGQWTQLNPDTFLLEDNAAITVGDVTGGKSISLYVADTTDGASPGHEATGSFNLVAGTSDLTITNTGNTITLTSANDNDNTTYALTTSASQSGVNAGTIVLTPTAYSKTNPQGVPGTPQNINLLGTGNVSISSDASGNITINSSGGIDDVYQDFDSNGNLETSASLSVGGTIGGGTVLPQIVYGKTQTTTAKFEAVNPNASGKSKTGSAVLDVYTTAQVDAAIENALSAADALTYMGAITDNTDAATKIKANATVGEVYKAATNISVTYNDANNQQQNVVAKTGDLIISEGDDGRVSWVVIPSGDDQFIEIESLANDNNFTFIDNNLPMGGFSINNGNSGITVTSTVPNTGYKAYSISHATPSTGTAITISAVVPAVDPTTSVPNSNPTELSKATNSTGNYLDIPIVTALSTDTYGHVTSASGSTYRVWDTHGVLEQNTFAVSVTNNTTNHTSTATIGSTIVFDGQEASTTGNLYLKTEQDSLQLSAEGTNTVKIDLVWGTF